MTHRFNGPLIGIVLTGLAFAVWPSSLWAQKIDFSRDVQPILSDKCFACHGPDEQERAADLRLDTQQGASAVLSAGGSEESELLRRITAEDESSIMPPPEHKKPLTTAEIAVLRQWIQQGASWSRHWAFEAPLRPALPQIKDAEHPIDAFVCARLRQENLSGSPAASKAKWLRRLCLDLTGLPPTLDQLDQFLGDDSPEARKTMVQQLLASDHFGERWARWWMDAARYADSNGYEKDSVRYVWPYRDWLIDAFNDNLPYDQFVIKQIAGDLLPEATVADRVATGFLRNSMVNEEGAIKYEQFRVEGIFDRIDAIGKSVLGLTMQCAQCHTHKYDPITHDEYYGMFAYLNNMHEATVAYYTAEQRDQIAQITEDLQRTRERIQSANPQWREDLERWIAERKGDFESEPSWTVVTPELLGDGGQKFYPQPDGSLIAKGFSPAKSTERFAGQTTLPVINSIRLELLMDPYLTYGGPGRSIEGTAALSELKLFAGESPDSLSPVALTLAKADLDPPKRPIDSAKYPLKNGTPESDRVEGPASFATDGDMQTAWATETDIANTNQPRVLVVNLKQPLQNPGAAAGRPLHLRFEIACQHGGWNSNDNHHRNLGRFRLSLASQRFPEHRPETPRVREAMDVERAHRSPAETKRLFDAWISASERFADEAAEMAEIRSRHPRPTPQLVAQERESQRRVTRLFHRGEQHQPRHEVQPHVPASLHPLPHGQDPQSRLTFARWLVDRRSPTTARTLVNRVWQAVFGTGLVESVEDLGHQATRASHPQLLDWLAVEFMESGWDFKHLVSLIVTSETYAQRAHHRPDLAERDPRNRLLARGPRFRPEAEMVRDIQLAASGLLDRDVGGQSVFPPIPQFLFNPPVSFGYKVWREDTAPQKRYRRALYTFRFRTVPPPFMAAFDAPTGEVSCVRRPRSTTPLQALAMLNEPLSIEAAEALGGEIKRQDEDLRGALSAAFRCCTSRTPSDGELNYLLRLFEQESTAGDVDPYVAVARVLLNLDETITK
ncbi:PSD1 and planctomycete cytochrome C domain-containing protein [Roseimaritima sediminicola]|uniref:PSD1 and planctomycete cytochrome C domain-containing protein n=1 Tax=Roseimaritima sediminicola TaxID=2662066 RepID=UPI0012982C33|nr:PSD1 and planctomycete cytochrome C domain-containing protein [Roseimaritima sediminicola]